MTSIKLERAGELRRVSVEVLTFQSIKELVGRLFNDAAPENCKFGYVDNDGDFISITNDTELEEALRLSKLYNHVLKIIVKPQPESDRDEFHAADSHLPPPTPPVPEHSFPPEHGHWQPWNNHGWGGFQGLGQPQGFGQGQSQGQSQYWQGQFHAPHMWPNPQYGYWGDLHNGWGAFAGAGGGAQAGGNGYQSQSQSAGGMVTQVVNGVVYFNGREVHRVPLGSPCNVVTQGGVVYVNGQPVASV